jgi:hypothetical protein
MLHLFQNENERLDLSFARRQSLFAEVEAKAFRRSTKSRQLKFPEGALTRAPLLAFAVRFTTPQIQIPRGTSMETTFDYLRTVPPLHPESEFRLGHIMSTQRALHEKFRRWGRSFRLFCFSFA